MPEDKVSIFLNDFASKQEVAAEFNVTPRTIERWVRLRTFPSPIKVGRKSLFHIPTIQMHLNAVADAAPSALRAINRS